MNILKRIVVWILIFCLVLSIVASAVYSVAYASDSEDFDSNMDTASPTLDYPYFEFTNMHKIDKNDDYIVVTELIGSDDDAYYLYDVFEDDGEYKHSFKITALGDLQKVQIYGNTAVSLNYLSDDSSMLYSTMLIDYADNYTGSSNAMLDQETSHYIRDFTIADDYLYYIKVGLSSSIKKMKLGGGVTVTTAGTELSVDIDLTNFTAIESCGNDIIFETEYTNLYHFDTDTEELTKLDTPSGTVIQYGGYDNYVFILTTDGLYYCDIETSSEFELLLEVTDEYSTDTNIVDPVSFAVAYEGGLVKIYIADNEGAMALKSFSLSEGMLVSGMFSIYSFSSSEEGYNTPTSLSSSYDAYVVADSGNNRVKVIEDGDDISIFYTVDADGDYITPIYAGIDYQKNIYVISDDNELFVYTSSGNYVCMFDSFEGSSFRSIYGLDVSPYDSVCYFASATTIYAYNHSTGELYNPVPSITRGDGIAIDYYNFYAGIYDDDTLDVYSLATGELIYSESKLDYIGDLYSVVFDLKGNFYALCSSSSYSVVSKYSLIGEDHDDYEEGVIGFERVASSAFNEEENNNFIMMTINFEEEMAYFIREDEHRVYETDDLFDDLYVQYDIDCDIPNNIFELMESEDVQILDVLDSGNSLLLPVSKNDDYYPSGYAIIRPIRLAENSKVIVTGYSDDGELCYVLYNNSVGFMYTSALAECESEAELPFEDALSLHDNAYIYKYPLSTTSDLVPLYGYAQIEKDTPITVVNLANDYVCPMGMLWYRVEAEVDGEVLVGYMPRYNVVENSTETDDTYEYGRINANLFEGYATVYADEGVTELGKKIYDGEKVEILAERGDYYYVREADPTGDTAIEGYVLKELVTTDSQTRSFTIAIVLIILLVIAVIIIVAVKIRHKKKGINKYLDDLS
ncbi:MAG: hypothetical protein R3Y32_04860 [Bacillota bacterium]